MTLETNTKRELSGWKITVSNISIELTRLTWRQYECVLLDFGLLKGNFSRIKFGKLNSSEEDFVPISVGCAVLYDVTAGAILWRVAVFTEPIDTPR